MRKYRHASAPDQIHSPPQVDGTVASALVREVLGLLLKGGENFGILLSQSGPLPERRCFDPRRLVLVLQTNFHPGGNQDLLSCLAVTADDIDARTADESHIGKATNWHDGGNLRRDSSA